MASAGEVTPKSCSFLDNSEVSLERQQLFANLDARMRQLDQQWSEMWIEAADICLTVEQSHLWREGGFHSYSDWLAKACPRSRSWVYLAVGARKELKDIPDVDLRNIPLGNAEILKNIPRSSRTSRSLLEAAKCHPPRSFIATVLAEAPNANLERLVKKHFAASAWVKISDTLDLYRRIREDSCIGDAECIEGIMQEWREEHE